MSNIRVLIYHSPAGRERPERIAELARGHELEVREQPDVGGVIDAVNRSYPAGVVIELDEDREGLELCVRLKSDTFTGIVPVLFLLRSGSNEALRLEALEAGADELLEDGMSERERRLRFGRALDRAYRDVSVHPTTRLAGTAQIERDMAERLSRGELFACCYADLDHFKEFNDRYSYNQGDRVIRMLSRILRDTVKYYAPTGFIGHIGGDDFIFDVPLEAMRISCEEVISIFDELVPYQYNERDRRAGYFLGKDRRGMLHRVPLMTLSIGVVTTQYRQFTHTGRISELVTEMKAYAKSLPGSVFAVDRRRDVHTGKAADFATATVQTQPEPKP